MYAPLIAEKAISEETPESDNEFLFPILAIFFESVESFLLTKASTFK